MVKLKQKRVVVTGAAGVLGSHLCDALIADGNSILGIDDLCTGNLENLKSGRFSSVLSRCWQ
jgi:dTDP-glucose 4,6-dehydratase